MLTRFIVSVVAIIGYVWNLKYLFWIGGLVCLGFLMLQYTYYIKEQNDIDDLVVRKVKLEPNLKARKSGLNLARFVTIGLIVGILYLISNFWSGIWETTLWIAIIIGLFDIPVIFAKLLQKS
ncbi:MAG: hypothetical protein Q8L30_00010 [bacterium]|nr:hypothetical protein [bacterium]